MTHILSNLTKEYQNNVEILEDKFDYNNTLLNIERINDKFSVKYEQMNKQSTMKTSGEYEK